jgi:hypothetical protein
VAAARESLQLFTNRYTGAIDNYLQVIIALTIALRNERNTIAIVRCQVNASLPLIKDSGEAGMFSRLS